MATDAAGLQRVPDQSLDNSDDFYYFGRERVQLRRSLTEAVVRFRETPTTLMPRLTGTAASTFAVGGANRSNGQAFHVVTLADTGQVASPKRLGQQLSALPNPVELVRSDPAIDFVAPVFYYPGTAARVLPTDQVVVKLKGNASGNLATVIAAYGFEVAALMKGTTDEYVLHLTDPLLYDAVERSRALVESGRFEWAEPDFIQEYQKQAVPNDPRFGSEWHLNNTGQGGGVPGADVKAVAAWDIQRGSSSVVIAVVDDGVEIGHEDLAPNIFVNPGEIPGNGLDDDGNGFVDDVSGWDFSNNDNDASPATASDNHGTAVAGVAAARGNNSIGVTGACQNCRILPVKIFTGTNFASDSAIANAIRYASRFADVINNSWGGGAPSSIIQSGIQDAITTGRNGRGSVVLFASGNSASGYQLVPINLAAGTYTFRWQYRKDVSFASGDDALWLGWILFPGGELVSFENGFAAGWTGGGNAVWSIVTDGAHADEGRCFTRAARSGVIGDSQSTFIQVTKTVPAGTLFTYAWVSSEAFFDGMEIFVNNTRVFSSSGVPPVTSAVAFPAAHPEAIAVGASSNFDCRSDYSEFGPQLAFVAPSSGGPFNLGIESTDRMGANGYDAAGNYTQAFTASGFGGTSSASPLAAGIAGLILSKNRSLTRTQVLQIMQNSADKVGPEPYVAGRNNRYGFGRLNAFRALLLTPANAQTALVTTVSATGATLNGTVNPNGLSTTVVFEYGTTTAYGNQITATPSPVTGSAPVPVTATLSTLACSTTYHYRVVSTNSDGVNQGDDLVFRTLECPGINNLFLQHTASGCMVAWHMNRVSLLTQDFLLPNCVSDPNWRIAGSADFDADGRPDILFQNIASGGILVWLMNGIVIKEQRFLTPAGVSDPNWRVVAVGQFDADGRPDLIIQNRADGRMVAWLLTGTVLKTQVFLNPSQVADPNWRIVGAGDIDLDGKSDLFFQNIASGFMLAWFMNGISLLHQEFINPNRVDPAWAISAVTDVNDDTRPDLILQNVNDGRMVAWPLNGTNLIGQLLLNPFQVSDPRWRIVGPR